MEHNPKKRNHPDQNSLQIKRKAAKSFSVPQGLKKNNKKEIKCNIPEEAVSSEKCSTQKKSTNSELPGSSELWESMSKETYMSQDNDDEVESCSITENASIEKMRDISINDDSFVIRHSEPDFLKNFQLEDSRAEIDFLPAAASTGRKSSSSKIEGHEESETLISNSGNSGNLRAEFHPAAASTPKGKSIPKKCGSHEVSDTLIPDSGINDDSFAIHHSEPDFLKNFQLGYPVFEKEFQSKQLSPKKAQKSLSKSSRSISVATQPNKDNLTKPVEKTTAAFEPAEDSTLKKSHGRISIKPKKIPIASQQNQDILEAENNFQLTSESTNSKKSSIEAKRKKIQICETEKQNEDKLTKTVERTTAAFELAGDSTPKKSHSRISIKPKKLSIAFQQNQDSSSEKEVQSTPSPKKAQKSISKNVKSISVASQPESNILEAEKFFQLTSESTNSKINSIKAKRKKIQICQTEKQNQDILEEENFLQPNSESSNRKKRSIKVKRKKIQICETEKQNQDILQAENNFQPTSESTNREKSSNEAKRKKIQILETEKQNPDILEAENNFQPTSESTNRKKCSNKTKRKKIQILETEKQNPDILEAENNFQPTSESTNREKSINKAKRKKIQIFETEKQNPEILEAGNFLQPTSESANRKTSSIKAKRKKIQISETEKQNPGTEDTDAEHNQPSTSKSNKKFDWEKYQKMLQKLPICDIITTEGSFPNDW